MDIHSHKYLLINDIAHTIILYSTGKCEDGNHLSLLVGICGNGNPFLYIIYLLINDTAHTIILYSTGVPMYHLSLGICANVPWKIKKNIICFLSKKSNIFFRVFFLCHLLVGICENGYPLAHIPTNKWYTGSSSHYTVLESAMMGPLSHISKYIWEGGTINPKLLNKEGGTICTLL